MGMLTVKLGAGGWPGWRKKSPGEEEDGDEGQGIKGAADKWGNHVATDRDDRTAQKERLKKTINRDRERGRLSRSTYAHLPLPVSESQRRHFGGGSTAPQARPPQMTLMANTQAKPPHECGTGQEENQKFKALLFSLKVV